MSSTKKKNVLFFFIDALRYDVVNDEAVRRELMPNLHRLLGRGFFVKTVANAGATQYVLPSLLTQSYPFDYGGYNTGIENRPKSIVEVLKESGYATYATVSSYLYVRVPGFFRGFDHVRGLYPVLRIINKVILHQLSHEIALWKAGERSESELIGIVQHWFRKVLGGVKEYCEDHPPVKHAKRFRRRNEALIGPLTRELELVEKEPRVIIEKLQDVDPVYYWTTFGKRRYDWTGRLIRIRDAVYTRLMKKLFWTGLFPRQLKYQDMPLDEMIYDLPGFLDGARQQGKPWFLYLHILNVHSFHVFPGLRHQLRKYRLLPRCVRARRRLGRTWQPLMHDLTLLDLDHDFGLLIDELRASGDLEETLIFTFGDHGRHLGDRGAEPDSPRGFRTHAAFLDTVLAVAGTDRRPPPGTVIDSQGVAATVLDLLGIAPHPSFKGISALEGGREAVVSETAGRGYCDLVRKDLYFTVTSKTHKLFTVLRGDSLEVVELVDLRCDPDELHDVSAAPENRDVIESLLSVVYAERADILSGRGALRHREAVTG